MQFQAITPRYHVLKTLRPPKSRATLKTSEVISTRSFRRVGSCPQPDVPRVAKPSDTVVSICRGRERRQLVDITGIVLNNNHGFQVAGNLLEPVQ